MSEFFNYDKSPELDQTTEPVTKKPADEGTLLNDGAKIKPDDSQQPPQPPPDGKMQPDSDAAAEKFYGETQRKEIGEGLDPLFADEGIDPFDKAATADQQARRTAAIESAHAVGFTRRDVDTLAQMLPEYNAMDADEHVARRTETFEAYKKERPDNYKADLELAREYLTQPKHKVIANWLAVTGIANDIRTVRRVVELARGWAKKGKPK